MHSAWHNGLPLLFGKIDKQQKKQTTEQREAWEIVHIHLENLWRNVIICGALNFFWCMLRICLNIYVNLVGSHFIRCHQKGLRTEWKNEISVYDFFHAISDNKTVKRNGIEWATAHLNCLRDKNHVSSLTNSSSEQRSHIKNTTAEMGLSQLWQATRC